MQKVLLLDNYDSFTYNLFHYLENRDVKVDVRRNDDLTIDHLLYDKVVLSPGPGLPQDAGVLMRLIDRCKGEIPVLGICLGMQAIAEFLGGELYNQKFVKHGVCEPIEVNEKSPLFIGIAPQMNVGLYHSWAVKEGGGDFEVTARSKNNVVMAIQNKKLGLYGVQFHPESIMTENGQKVLENFLSIK